MAALAFLQKAQDANKLKEMSKSQQMLMRSVTKTLADNANEAILDERQKNRSVEVDVGLVIENAVLSIGMQDIQEKMAEEKQKKKRIDKCSNNSLLSSTEENVSRTVNAVQGSAVIPELVESVVNSGEIIENEIKKVMSDKTSTSSVTSSAQTLTEILNDIQNVSAPNDIEQAIISNDTTKSTKKVL